MKKIGIVGTGISGMTIAFLLKKAGHDITVFEQNDYIGGHTNTYNVLEENGNRVPVDTGFIVFNEENYPYLNKLFRLLDVPEEKTNMSFSLSDYSKNLEYCGSTLNTLFCQRRNILRPGFYKLLMEINTFNQKAVEVLNDPKFQKLTIKEYFELRGIGKLCFDQYIVPMSVALWSAPTEQILDFPILSLVRFFNNHGLMGFTKQFQWKTVKGGSQEYRKRLIDSFKEDIRVSSRVSSVERSDGKIVVTIEPGNKNSSSPDQFDFDHVFMASHADQTFQILKNQTTLEKELLKEFKYQANIIDLHTDETIMPQRKLGWASWNHVLVENENYISYWMNNLQKLNTHKQYFVSLNASKVIDEKKIVKKIEYHHPIFDLNALKSQNRLHELNQYDEKLDQNKIFFAGSYFGNGFHEDGIRSGVQAVESFLKERQLT